MAHGAPVHYVLRVLGHANHGGAQYPVAQAVAALQFINHVMVGNLVGLHHLDGLVQAWIEGLSLGGNRFHAKPRQHVVELAVDQLHAGAEVFGGDAFHLQRAVQAVQNRKHLLQRIGERVFAELLLLAQAALAEVFKLRLQTRQAVQIQRILRLSAFPPRTAARAGIVAGVALREVRAPRPSEGSEFLRLSFWFAYSESFNSLSKSRAM